MNTKQEALKVLDAAIDGMNQEEIDRSLARLTAMETRSIEAENVKVFAARIKKLERERRMMIKNKKTVRIALIAAAITVIASVGVYASGVLNKFSFADGDRFTTVRTTESMTESEAKELAEDSKSGADSESKAQAAQTKTPESEKMEFETVEQAEKQLDMKVAIPASMPDLPLTPVSAQTIKWGDDLETRTIWAMYGDPGSKALGITVEKTIMKPDSDMTMVSTDDMDEGSLGEYKSKTGGVYTLLSESDDTGEKTARIANITVGSHEYNLVFVGFEETEMHEIIDSADLSIYQ